MKIEKAIDFINKQNPKSRIDLIKIEDIKSKQTKDHSSYQFHILKFYALLFVTHGKGEHFIDFNSYSCEKGTVLFIGNGQVHRFSETSNLKGFLLPFHDDAFNFLNIKKLTNILQLFNNALITPKVQLDNDTFLGLKNKFEQIKKEYFTVNDSHSNQIIAAELYTIFSILQRQINTNHDINTKSQHLIKFLAFQDLLIVHIFNTSKVQDYAKWLGISGKTLNHVIKSITKKQAKTYINEYYLLRIKRVLMNKELSIKECAFQTGFEDLSNFHNFFKHHIKLTPEQFRRKYS